VALATENDVGDEEMESILEDAYEFLQDHPDTPHINSEFQPEVSKAGVGDSSEVSRPGDESVSDVDEPGLALEPVLSPFSPDDVVSPASDQMDDDVGVGGHSKSRKRKHTLEADDPTARRATRKPTLPNGSIQTAAS
jgi:hypothetical protein